MELKNKILRATKELSRNENVFYQKTTPSLLIVAINKNVRNVL